MGQYKSLRDRCRYRSWNCLSNISNQSDPLWWNYVPGYGMLEKSGWAAPPAYFKGVKNMMKDYGSECLKLDVVNRKTDIVNYDMKLSKSYTPKSSALRNKIYELDG